MSGLLYSTLLLYSTRRPCLGTQFTCFASTKVQELTRRRRKKKKSDAGGASADVEAALGVEALSY
jgi:hypothetical protein